MKKSFVSTISKGEGSAVVYRSYDYVAKTTITTQKPGYIEAYSMGHHLYNVLIKKDGRGGYFQSCSCPYGAPCKHSIALARKIEADPNLLKLMTDDETVAAPTNPKETSQSSQILNFLKQKVVERDLSNPRPTSSNIIREVYYILSACKERNYSMVGRSYLAIEAGVADKKVGSNSWTMKDTRSAKSVLSGNCNYLKDTDRKILQIMSNLISDMDYDANNYSYNRVRIDDFSITDILKLLNLSPQVYYRQPKKRVPMDLKLDEPGELQMKITKEKEGWLFLPQLTNDSETKEVIIQNIFDYTPPIILTNKNRLIPLINHVDTDVVRTLLNSPALSDETINSPGLIETVLRSQTFVPFIIPEVWTEKIKDGVPIPCLIISMLNKSLGKPRLAFEYGEQRVEDGASAPLYLSGDDRGVFRRDKIKETEYRQYFLDNLTSLVLDTTSLISLISTLPSDWEIFIERDAPEKIHRSKVDFEFKTSSEIDWLDINGDVTVDHEKYSLAELILASNSDGQIVKLRGKNHFLPDDLYEKIKKLTPFGDKKTGEIKINRVQAGIVESLGDIIAEDSLHESWQKTLAVVRNYQEISQVKKIPGLSATLRPYQKHGVSYLNYLNQTGFGGLLADDMGLGKTLQTIALLTKIFTEQKSLFCLVIMPSSVLANWEIEIKKFSPQLRVHNYSGLKRIFPKREDAEIVLTTYGLLRIDKQKIVEQDFDYLILDEAHHAKNFKSVTAKTAREIRAKNKLCLTGTPIENNLLELYSQMEFLNPGIFGNLEEFKQNIAIPIEKYNDKEKSEHLQKMTKPFILRRTKEQVLIDLPQKTEQTIFVEMETRQQKFYDSIKNYYQTKVLGLVAKQGVAKSHLQILEALLRLRQACCDPRLIKPQTTTTSAKLLETIELVKNAIAEGHKILLFSQFTSMIDILEKTFHIHSIPFVTLTGQTATAKRAKIVADFQESPTPLVFLLSIKAGGVGINLTGADYVIHYDPWWNPAVEKQATDRAHRIGQTKPVTVYKIITKNSIEEKILQLQDKKRDLVDRIIVGEKINKELTKDDLEYLLR